MVHKILVVDDEKDVVNILKYILEKENDYKVIIAQNGVEAIEKAESSKPSLILLDVMMPELNGFDVCKRLKAGTATSEIPVIFLTAKDDEIDELIGLELGADDYIAKPISPRKIIARINSVIRRTYSNKTTESDLNKNIKFESLEIDVSEHRVKIDGEEIYFPKKEFQLLHFLLSNRGKLFTKEDLLNKLWGEDRYIIDRTIDVHIGNIRAKLGKYSVNLETIKGVGVLFNTKYTI